MDDLDALSLALLLDRNEPVDELEHTKSPLPWPAFEEVAAAPDEAVVVADVAFGVAVIDDEEVEEEDGDDDDGEGEEAAALAPVLGDAVQRLLLYVDFLRFRTELIHTLSCLVRDVIQRLFRVV